MLYRGHLVEAALLLQLKTLLDNADGALARATGQVTLTGRYLDTIADLVVNVAVFAALGIRHGPAVLAAGCLPRADGRAHGRLQRDGAVPGVARDCDGGAAHRPGAASNGASHSSIASAFGVLDRVVRGVSTRRFGERPAYDGFAVSVLANLGLTTQLAVLGVCLVLGIPSLYLWLALGCLLVLGALHVRAELRVRSACLVRAAQREALTVHRRGVVRAEIGDRVRDLLRRVNVEKSLSGLSARIAGVRIAPTTTMLAVEPVPLKRSASASVHVSAAALAAA